MFVWPAVRGMTGNGLDVPAYGLDDFPRCHVVIDAPSDVFYQDGERDPEQELTGMVIQPKPGTYALILSCTSNARIQIGHLGTMQLQRGYYVYMGSALGPGGLRTRIAHHQKPSPRPHWHIDYLRAHTRLHSVWLRYDGRRHEHEWARAMQKVKDATIPLPGFGASDCSCPSHLYFLKDRPRRTSFHAKCLLEVAAGEPLAEGSVFLPMHDVWKRPLSLFRTLRRVANWNQADQLVAWWRSHQPTDLGCVRLLIPGDPAGT